MRHRNTFVVLLIALVVSVTPIVDGQEEPLPVVQQRTTPVATFEDQLPQIDLPAEPIRDNETGALVDNSVYAEPAIERVASSPVLDELEQYAENSAIGAFYGAEMHDRIARAYPGFADYIAPYGIEDSQGNVFYPTAETRAFLRDRGRPRVTVAGETGVRPSPRARETVTTPRPRLRKAEVQTAPPQTAPRVVAPAPAPVVAAVAPAPAPVVTAPAPAPAPVVQAAALTPAPIPQNSRSGRGLLLLLIGIAGVGILAVLLRAPRETQPVSIIQPAADAPAAPVEPIRKKASNG